VFVDEHAPLVYAAYLVFQLWSHTHYYADSRTASNKLSKTIKDRAAEKRPDTSDRETSAARTSPYINPSYATSSEVTLRSPDAGSANKKFNQQPFSSPEWPTVNLAGDARRGDDRMCYNLSGADGATGAFRNNAEERQDSLHGTLEAQSADPKELALQPELSWTMTLMLLTAVTIVSLHVSYTTPSSVDLT
jgi:Ca2+:H+ antiporter